ncbi:MAG: sensor histidine kinase [Vicinamibacterales bacterium]
MRRITSRFVMLIATAAVAPLVIYGVVSIGKLDDGMKGSVEAGNLRVAQQVATQIKLYIDSNARVLRSVGEEIAGTRLAAWQQSRILKNHVLDFPEFREISLFDAGGRVMATSRLGDPATAVPSTSGATTRGVQVSRVFEDEDNLPAVDLSVRLRSGDENAAWLVGRISLEELWRFVDRVKVGDQGYALVLAEDHRIVAHGNPAAKRSVALPPEVQRRLPEPRLAEEHVAEITFARRENDENGQEKLFTGARVPDLNWTVMVEQPTSEAFAITTQFRRQLIAAIALALLGTIVLGWVWARSFITRIFALTAATRAIAEGRMDERVRIGGRDEIHQLGESFNAMADHLVELQEDVRKQERQAMFGRIAAGLVHDLSHPIQNIGNSCKLIVKMFDDFEYRETFRRTVEREMVIIKRVLDDLRNIARPIPLERFPVEINRSVIEVVESMQQHADTAGVTLRSELTAEPAFIDGDVFALGRVYRNLILNAIQATAPGGAIVVRSEVADDRVNVSVADTGCGIPPDRLSAIFEDFVTTKRRGLGLGLAISRKIVEQLGGQITVTSQVGRGTTFVLSFARTRARPMLVAG